MTMAHVDALVLRSPVTDPMAELLAEISAFGWSSMRIASGPRLVKRGPGIFGGLLLSNPLTRGKGFAIYDNTDAVGTPMMKLVQEDPNPYGLYVRFWSGLMLAPINSPGDAVTILYV